MRQVKKAKQAGFTLIELLIVILIVGILAAVAVPLYFGYIQDAKLAEGKALAGSVLSALQSCVSKLDTASAITPGCSPDLATIQAAVGITNLRKTGDDRWEVKNEALKLDALKWVGSVVVIGQADTNVKNLATRITITAGVMQTQCSFEGDVEAKYKDC